MNEAGRQRGAALIELCGRRPAISLSVFLILLGAVAAIGLIRSEGQIFNSDLFALIAPQNEENLKQVALTRIRMLSERRQTWLVTHADQDEARRAVQQLRQRLLATDLYESLGVTVQLEDIRSFYADYSFLLADPASLTLFASAGSQALVNQAERALYGSGATLPGLNLERDPFLLQANFLIALGQTPRPFRLDQGLLAARLNDTWTYLLPVALTSSAFDFNFQRKVEQLTELLASEIGATTGAGIASVGSIDFATANRKMALSEVGLIGGASLLLIVVLLFSTFRHPRPFLAVSFTIVTGIIGGLSLCLTSFNSVHLLTLIGGSSLIGISVDYAFHLLADSFRPSGSSWQTSQGLLSVLPTISLGLGTSLLGFAGLYASGFTGLQQIAVFSGAGLVTAYLGLVICYPALLGSWRPDSTRPYSLRVAGRWSTLWQPRQQVVIVLGIASITFWICFPPPEIDNDVRLLAAESAEIDELLDRTASLSASLLDSRFILVRAPDPEALLQREEALRANLGPLVAQGSLSHFNQLSQFVPSRKTQEQTRALNRTLLLNPGTGIIALQQRIGLKPSVVTELRRNLESLSPERYLTVADLLRSPLAPLAGDLYLGRIGDEVASIVTLAGVRDVETLESAISGLAGVVFVDNVADISRLFAIYVENAIRGLLIAFVLVAVLMLLRFGLREGAVTMLVPLVTFTGTLWLLQLLGEPLNLFHIVGLTLVLGTGMDYTLFLKAGVNRPHASLSVLLAAATTECAFGLLGLSQVRAIHSFGLTVALGTAITFLLAPMCARRPAGDST